MQQDGGWQNLDIVLAAGAALPAREAVKVAAAVLRDLGRFHAAGAVHGAVDPLHVLMNGPRARLANAGADLAQPPFASPERHAGQVVTPRSDVFSAGVVLYRLLTGQSPFAGANVEKRVAAMIPPPPSQVARDCPATLDAIVEKAMAKRPQDRWATAQEFAAALERALPPQSEPAGDATVMQPVSADSTVFRPVAADATVFQPVQADATVFQPVKADTGFQPGKVDAARPLRPRPVPQSEASSRRVWLVAAVAAVALVAAGVGIWLIAS